MLASPAFASGKAVPPSLPTPEDLASVEMEFGFTELFQMPAFANEWGYGQVSKSVSGVTGITFPPFACCGVPDVTWSPGLLTSCEVSVDGQLLAIAPKTARTFTLNLSDGQMNEIVLLTVAGIPMLVGLLGLGVWSIRRR